MEMKRISLGPEGRRRLKEEAVGGRPYADRVSSSLAVFLLAHRELWIDPFAVLDELDFLEGIRATSKTKPAAKFARDPRLAWLWHKHYSSARHMPRNLALRWGFGAGGNQAFERLITTVADKHGDDPDVWPRVLADAVVVGGYEARVGRLTGDWIIYAVHGGANYYLTLSTHREGHEPERLLERLRRQCQPEWPFLFDASRGA